MSRTQEDIKKIVIDATSLESGWKLNIDYKDGKSGEASIDYSKNDPDFDMLEATFGFINRQLASTQDN